MKAQYVKPGMLFRYHQNVFLYYVFVLRKAITDIEMIIMYIKPREGYKHQTLDKKYWDKSRVLVDSAKDINRTFKKKIVRAVFR
jgi:hypothetical protein